ncbi:RNA-dependent RNA polymerase [Fusarium mangiferae mitovirus 1]|nr:RNA-dependent RNA polymerase [Fusarium mangiferae mitovirus 1]
MPSQYGNLVFNYFKTSKRPKISSKAWISFREIKPFFDEVIWVSRLAILKDCLSILRTRICKLVKVNGFQFTFKYLKVVLHLTVRFLSGRPLLVYAPKGMPYVSIDLHGLPKFLPLDIRNFLLKSDLSKDSKTIGAILTLISIYRVFPTHVKPKLDTIVSEFTGHVKTFSYNKLKLACSDLLIGDINRKPNFDCKIIGGESAGPNGFKAAWTSGIDALAFIHQPLLLLSLSLWYWKYGKKLFFWFWFLIVLGFIPYTILLSFSPILRSNPLLVGRLSVVYNVAGKARVIAITNWWIQAAFKPLHDSLFSILKNIEQDGTFNQDRPLDILLSKDLDSKIHSFDLSAATDRLPMEIQRDILNIIYSDNVGVLWYNILKYVNWKYEDSYYSYAVGQPMGAYSSWAMLAVTHHVITRLASLNVNLSNFSDYAVLGDDFVIRNDAVADQYLDIMKYLGVDINLDKSVISNRFAEFAKRLKGPNIDITPLGPGLILRFIRDKFYIGAVVAEGIKLKWFSSVDDVLAPVLDRFPKKGNILTLVLWVCSGAGGAFVAQPTSTDHPLTDRMVPLWFGRYISPDNIIILNGLISSVGLAFTRQIREDLQVQRKLLMKEVETLYSFKWYKVFVSRLVPTMILESLLLAFSPGFYLYLTKINEAWDELDKKFDSLNSGFTTWEDISRLISLDPSLNFISIDWRNRKEVKKIGEKCTNLVKMMQYHFDQHVPNKRLNKKNANRINIAIF